MKPDPRQPAQRDALVQFFENAVRPDPTTHLIGTELEKFGVAPDDSGVLAPVDYDKHVLPVLAAHIEKYGWVRGPDRGTQGETVELRRDGASITLEPGGQLELSGAPLTNVHQTCAEFSAHYEELHAISEPLGITWMAVGHHPFATREEINWMPKGRYAIMRNYLPQRGSMALDMMLRTSTVQANFDYTSEAQAGTRFRLAAGLAPVIIAMFANSPYVEGKYRKQVSSRSFVWTDVDPDRCGIQPFFFESPFSFERYVDWALDVPMFFVKRDGRYHAHHATFAEFMRDGFTAADGTAHRASWADWEGHLSTLFPEVRLKPHLEFRSADAVGSRYLCALPALLKGLIYDDAAGAEAFAPLAGLNFDERMELWHEGVSAGLASPRIHKLARRIFKIAREALETMDVRDSKGRTEARFLDPMEALIEAGSDPGSEIRGALGDAPGAGAEARIAMAEAWHFAGAHPAQA